VTCRFNLLLDANERGAITLNLPKARGAKPLRVLRSDSAERFELAADAAVDAWFDAETPPPSCVLDEVTDERTLEEIGGVLCMTRERVRQIEKTARDGLDAGLAAMATRDEIVNG
jgi:hypothetical protein